MAAVVEEAAMEEAATAAEIFQEQIGQGSFSPARGSRPVHKKTLPMTAGSVLIFYCYIEYY